MAIIPAYNEEKNIGDIINRIEAIGFAKESILIINDGSEDRTGEISRKSGVNLVDHAQNLGKGAALKSGFSQSTKYSYIVTIDGDGQHLPEEIPLLFKKIRNCDMVIGNRKKKRGMPLSRIISNRTTSLVLSLITRQRILDGQCGFRLIRTEALKDIMLKTSKFDTESELIINMGRRKKKIGWVEVSTIYQNRESKINHLIDTLRFIILAIKALWR